MCRCGNSTEGQVNVTLSRIRNIQEKGVPVDPGLGYNAVC